MPSKWDFHMHFPTAVYVFGTFYIRSLLEVWFGKQLRKCRKTYVYPSICSIICLFPLNFIFYETFCTPTKLPRECCSCVTLVTFLCLRVSSILYFDDVSFSISPSSSAIQHSPVPFNSSPPAQRRPDTFLSIENYTIQHLRIIAQVEYA